KKFELHVTKITFVDISYLQRYSFKTKKIPENETPLCTLN
ncbi:hypothetical protein AVEN_40785-2-1, partial [Araneus ventricosus]